MKKTILFSTIILISVTFYPSILFASGQVSSVLEKIGVTRGICVVLGDPECELALELVKNSELLIYMQLDDAEDFQKAAKAADSAGVYGIRIFIFKGGPRRLHLAENIADALVAVGDSAKISESEALRVIRPQGKAFLGNKILTKSFPQGIDDWTHPYHGPDNNPQSNDKIARAPYLTRFMAEPRYASLPQTAVTSAGRLFKAFGHVAFHKREESLLNTLAAFNGYNGTMLWKQPIAEGFMVHRSTMIATPDILYFADSKSCKLYDAATGELKDQIIPPRDAAGGTFWKWMALEDGILYALIGEQEQKAKTKRWRLQKHGWPWNPICEGYNQPDNPWGFGRNVLAINPKTKKVIWHHREEQPIDSRAVCMKNNRIFIFRFGAYIGCLDAKTGKTLWRKTPDTDPKLFHAFGEYSNRQDWRTNWRTTNYLMCSNDALYFAGPQVGKLLALSAKDGSILWENPYDNFQLVLSEDALYGFSGTIDKKPSIKFDPLTGKVLAEIDQPRRSCTRPTGSVDSIFFRSACGTVRIDTSDNRRNWISPMRPQCHDGVNIANGLLYWWPSVCDCSLSILGITCLGPAAEFDFTARATETQRLEKLGSLPANISNFSACDSDWPTFRANNKRTATTKALVPEKTQLLWHFDPKKKQPFYAPAPTPPIAAGGLVFSSGPDGIVYALNASTGKVQWKAYTSGPVRYPPTYYQGQVLVGSGDGYVYNLEAGTGKTLWRFRGAPKERMVPVYGQLSSTWPAATGVLVENGTAYFAAGMVSYDGTYVYALDAETGKIIWQNNTSGHLDKRAQCGVNVHGHLLVSDNKLYMAGGTSISPAIYDITDGRCLNDPNILKRGLIMQNWLISPRGSELYLVGDKVIACGKPFYAHPKYKVYDSTVFEKMLVTKVDDKCIIWPNNYDVICYKDKPGLDEKILKSWGKWGRNAVENAKPLWPRQDKQDTEREKSQAVAVAQNAVVVAKKSEILAMSIDDGSILWSHPLPATPVLWGLAIDSDGSSVVTLEDGRILCFGKRDLADKQCIAKK